MGQNLLMIFNDSVRVKSEKVKACEWKSIMISSIYYFYQWLRGPIEYCRYKALVLLYY